VSSHVDARGRDHRDLVIAFSFLRPEGPLLYCFRGNLSSITPKLLINNKDPELGLPLLVFLGYWSVEINTETSLFAALFSAPPIIS
jgi:hypothetical protein